MSKKLTRKDIDSFTYQGGWDVRWDSLIPGFGVRIFPSGKKSYVLSYRNEKRQKRLLTIAQTGKITLDQARNAALKNLATLTDKIDPAEEKKKRHTGRTMENISHEYIDKYVKQTNRTWKEIERIFIKDIVPVLGSKLIQDVTKHDIISLIDRVVERGSKTMANRTLANVRRFFNWCIERALIETSPAEKLSKPTAEKSRDRVLSESEIIEIWNACESEGYPYGTLVQILLLTGQRRNEVSKMQWHEVDFDRNIWTLPRERTKSDRRHEIPLSNLAQDLLGAIRMQRMKGVEYVFTTLGSTPFSGFSVAKKRLDGIISRNRKERNIKQDFPEWRLHDLRRTAASGMAELGAAPHIIERVLNHSSGIVSGVAAVYNRYDYRKEVGNALEEWSFYLQRHILLKE